MKTFVPREVTAKTVQAIDLVAELKNAQEISGLV